MTGPGFRRRSMGGWHLRVVEDRGRAFAYLSRAWSDLPASFFDWLRTGEHGTCYRLTGYVFQPELWVHPNIAPLTIQEPALVPVLAHARLTEGDSR